MAKSNKTVHSGKKSYECNVCMEGFSLAWNLNKHKTVHTGGKPFDCNVCKKVFTLAWSLQ